MVSKVPRLREELCGGMIPSLYRSSIGSTAASLSRRRCRRRHSRAAAAAAVGTARVCGRRQWRLWLAVSVYRPFGLLAHLTEWSLLELLAAKLAKPTESGCNIGSSQQRQSAVVASLRFRSVQFVERFGFSVIDLWTCGRSSTNLR